jgi:hypothetical protein
MNNIETYSDLMQEKLRLESALKAQKGIIKKDISAFTERFMPVSESISTVGKFFTRDKHNPIVNAGVSLAGNVILKNIVLSRAGWLTRLVVPYLVKNFSSHLLNKSLNKKGGNFFHKLGEKLKGTNNSKVNRRLALEQPLLKTNSYIV